MALSAVLAGGNWYTIIGSHATGKVSGTNTVGGLAGWNAGPIGTSYATGDVAGTRSVGGLVGDNNLRGRIISSHARGMFRLAVEKTEPEVWLERITISSKEAMPQAASREGLLWVVWSERTLPRGTIMSSYATGAVSGYGGIGGLVGYGSDSSVVIGSYAVGRVSGSYGVGGIVGRNDGSSGISDSYWNIETSGQGSGVGSGPLSGAEGKTTSELQMPTSYAGIYLNWNTDIDEADGDGYETTGVDDPWHFGTDDQYPALRADFDGDGEATWEEFGLQIREGPPPSDMDVPLQPNTIVTPLVTPSPSCTNGIVVENPQESRGLASDCTVLLQSRDILAGRDTLNWSADIPIDRWQGITVGTLHPVL